jgi:hypothetical protein
LRDRATGVQAGIGLIVARIRGEVKREQKRRTYSRFVVVVDVDGTKQSGYKAGQELVPLRWVFVRDVSGTHRDEYFFTTDPRLTPRAVIGHYCDRWNIETTFQEARCCLCPESTRGWCLLGLYSVAALLFRAPPRAKRTGAVAWPGKATVTFSDALCAVRRWLRAEAGLPQTGNGTALKKLSEPIRERPLTALAPAA